MKKTRTVHVVGAGITGVTAAWYLRRQAGAHVVIHEARPVVGGQLRGESWGGIPYEPHGPHIFHTNNREAWAVANRWEGLNGYRHRVKTMSPRGLISWPPQVDELKDLHEWPTIARELDELPHENNRNMSSFESYAVDVMGPTLYEWLCYGYTRKQWGREPKELSAVFAPKRIDLRTDGYKDLFRDTYQGWYRGGWHRLIEALISESEADVELGHEMTINDLPRDADGYVITAALDQFMGVLDLPWRGVAIRHRQVVPSARRHYQEAPVINYPDPDVPFTRTTETAQMAWVNGPRFSISVQSTEYPGALVRHYPVYDANGENRRRATGLSVRLHDELPNTVLAGRLANYAYIDIDQAIMQGLNAARRLIRNWEDA